MTRWKALTVLLLVAVLKACGQPQTQSSGSAAAVPTSPNAAAESAMPSANTSAAATAVTQVANEEITTAPETITVQAASNAASGTAATATSDSADLVVDKSRLAQELHFYNWTDYIDPTILEDFEKEYGVKVVMDLFDANEDMIAKVRPGNSGYDLVAPSDYAVETMAREQLIAPLDKSLIPNIRHIKPQNLDLYFDKGNQVSVPYMFGITGIAYDKSKVTPAPDSWAVLFDAAQMEKYNGQFSMLDDEREVPGAALKFLGKSLNETDAATLQQVQDILTKQKPYLAAYNSSDVSRKLASGEYVMAHAWSGMAMQARNGLGEEFSGNPNIEFFIPKEGGMIWQDNLVILADAADANKYTAHVFINYLLRPDIAARNTEYIGYLTPNASAESMLPEEIQALYRQGFAPDEETYKRLEWAVRNETTTAFTDLWTAVKGE